MIHSHAISPLTCQLVSSALTTGLRRIASTSAW